MTTYVKASGAGDLFGIALALSADGATLAVGANGEASNATGLNGAQTDDSAPSSAAVYLYPGLQTIRSKNADLRSLKSNLARPSKFAEVASA